MSRLVLKPHHLQNLTTPVAAGLAALFKMYLEDDVSQQASLEILLGKPAGVALRHARAEISRQNKPSGWESFDAENPDGLGLAERLAAPAPTEIERWRVADLSAGTASLGKTARRLQQIWKKKVEVVAAGQLDFFVEVVE